MMNKTKVIEKYNTILKSLDEPGHNVIMSAGSALVLLGIRKNTDMVNVSVPPNVFKYLSMTKEVINRNDVSPYIQMDAEARIHPSNEYTGVACVEGIWIFSLSELLLQKCKVMSHPNRIPFNKIRDKKEIEKLEEMIKAGKTVSRMV